MFPYHIQIREAARRAQEKLDRIAQRAKNLFSGW